ncbi:MAG: hypothetical protein ABEJ82_09060 [Haloplanus sp.]
MTLIDAVFGDESSTEHDDSEATHVPVEADDDEPSSRRWPRRLLVLGAVVAGVVAYRRLRRARRSDDAIEVEIDGEAVSAR